MNSSSLQSSCHAGAAVADDASREREFTRAASHELRTPLTVIRVASDLIEHDPGLSEASKRSLARIQDAVSGMEAIIDALLLLARGERCAMEAEYFSVRELVEQELAHVRPLLEHKQLKLDVKLDAAPVLHAPPCVLRVMLGNLLNNAARFTDAGEVRVRLGSDRLSVEDTGIGMDAATLARACEPFYRGESEQGVGPGLGLAIAHRLGQRCGWPLQLQSAPGQGTCASILFGDAIRD